MTAGFAGVGRAAAAGRGGSGDAPGRPAALAGAGHSSSEGANETVLLVLPLHFLVALTSA